MTSLSPSPARAASECAATRSTTTPSALASRLASASKTAARLPVKLRPLMMLAESKRNNETGTMHIITQSDVHNRSIQADGKSEFGHRRGAGFIGAENERVLRAAKELDGKLQEDGSAVADATTLQTARAP